MKGGGCLKNIETKRLFLREWQESDAQDHYNICRDMELQLSGISTYNNVEESLNTIRIWKNKDEMKAIISKEDNCLIGFICLGDMNRYPQYKELEYAISNKYRNKGYATEALTSMLDFTFNELDILVVAAWVRSFNIKCVRVLEKCSFTHEGTLRRHARDRGDTLCYSILKEEWENFYRLK